MIVRTLKPRFVVLPFAFALAAMRPEAAAAAEPAAGASKLDEIIVTARKVQESQQSLPIAIAAFSEKDIEQNVVLNVSDLGSVVTGLVVTGNSQGGAPTFAIRGTFTDNGIDGGVAIYFDDMPLLSSYSIANSFYDIASVEVLKGPQGTQFGTNTTGGTISIRAKKPTDEFEAYAQAGYGDYSRSEFEGMINVPLSEAVQVRLAGNMVKQDEGFIKNRTPTGGIPEEFNDDDHYSLRGSIRIQPNDGITNDIVADYFHEDDQRFVVGIPVMFTSGPISPSAFPAYAQLGTWKSVSVGANPSGITYPPYNEQKMWGVQDVLNWEINDNISIKNVLGYRRDDTRTNHPDSGTTLNLITNSFHAENKFWVNDFTVGLTSNNKRLRGNAGLFVSNANRLEQGNANLAQNAFLLAPPPVNTFNVISGYSKTRDLDSYAVYANVDYDLTDQLTVTLGGRYNWDSGDFKYTWIQGPFNGIGPPTLNQFKPSSQVSCNPVTVAALPDNDIANCVARNDDKWRSPSYNFVLTNKFSERSLVYFKASGAYLAGGFNAGIREPVGQTFDPEKTYSFETGIKSDWTLWDRPIRTNFDVFYGQSKDKQEFATGTYAGGTPWFGVLNAGSLTFYGLDLEVKYRPVDSLDLNAAWTRIKASFDQFTFPQIGNTPSADLSGNSPAQVPQDTLSLGAAFRWPFPSTIGEVTSAINTSYSSAVHFFDAPSLFGAGGVQVFPDSANQSESHWVSNFSSDWRGILGSGLDIGVWVKNVFDKRYITKTSAQAPLGYATAYYGDPRTYGVNVRYNF